MSTFHHMELADFWYTYETSKALSDFLMEICIQNYITGENCNFMVFLHNCVSASAFSFENIFFLCFRNKHDVLEIFIKRNLYYVANYNFEITFFYLRTYVFDAEIDNFIKIHFHWNYEIWVSERCKIILRKRKKQ